MRIIKISIFLFFLVFYSCKKSNFVWKVYSSEETNLLLKNERIEGIQVLNDDVYLIGSYGSARNLPKFKAMIYKADINKLDFSLVSTDTGVFYTSSLEVEDNLYLMKRVFTENSFANTKSYLCNLNLLSENLKVIDEIIGVTKSIHFKNDHIGYLFVNETNKGDKNVVLKTVDAGKTWDTIQVNKVVSKTFYGNDRLYLLENYYNQMVKKRINGRLYETDFVTKKLNEINFDLNIIDINISNVSNNLLLLCNNNNFITLEIYENGVIKRLFDFGEDENLFPKKIHRYKNFISVVIGELNSIGTNNYLYLSFDGGKTFKEEILPVKNLADPIFFYKDEKIIVYSGAGRISVCDLKK